MASKNNDKKRVLKDSAAIRGVERKRFFEEVGDLARWRGRSATHTDRKKRASKRACRGRVRDY